MIKMQIKQIWQAKCPFCGKVTHYVHKEDELFCHCDEGQGYFINWDNENG